jgi:hypothetical protein
MYSLSQDTQSAKCQELPFVEVCHNFVTFMPTSIDAR